MEAVMESRMEIERTSFRECQLPRMINFGVRTIQRKLLTGEFPKPDYFENRGRRKIKFWYAETIETYKKSRMIFE
jgi:hypothetical protein